MDLDPTLPLKHPSVLPPRRGAYVRDWRGTDIEPASDRRLCVDLWLPVRDRRSILHPGVWYVLPERNDASEQRLPWRDLSERELAAYQRGRR